MSQAPLHTRPLFSSADLLHNPELNVSRRNLQPSQLWDSGKAGPSVHLQDSSDVGAELRHGVLPLPLRHPDLPGDAGQHEGARHQQDERQVENVARQVDQESNQRSSAQF